MGISRHFVVQLWPAEPATTRFRAEVRDIEDPVGLCFRTPGAMCSFFLAAAIVPPSQPDSAVPCPASDKEPS
jgi:hypothetical protein